MAQNSSNQLYTPGQDDVPAGEYVEVDSRGKELNQGRQVSIGRGDRLPPTQESGNKWMFKG